MPKGMGYSTGGKKEPKGDHGFNAGGNMVNVTSSGAGMGTGAGQPNAKTLPAPGGYGSTGGKSTSTPSSKRG